MTSWKKAMKWSCIVVHLWAHPRHHRRTGPQSCGVKEIGMVMAPQVEFEDQNAGRETTGQGTQVLSCGDWGLTRLWANAKLRLCAVGVHQPWHKQKATGEGRTEAQLGEMNHALVEITVSAKPSAWWDFLLRTLSFGSRPETRAQLHHDVATWWV